MSAFISDLEEIRRRAREQVNQGAGADGNGSCPERDEILKLLNQSLATELVCVLRYKRHQFMGAGIHSEAVVAEFAAHAVEEQEHADRIAARIVQLNGEPDFNPKGLLSRSVSEYVEGKDLVDMIKENLIAERIAVDTYREIIKFIGESDPTTRRMLESILEKEEEHVEDMANLLNQN